MKIVSYGDLGYRLTQSFSRNECKYYKPEYIWTADKNSWSADWEGRTILALVSLAKATGKEPAYLEEILRLLPSYLNEKGYLGEIYPNGGISEQQLAGHGWLLRGLIEYSLWKKTDKIKPIIERIVKNLYIPVIDELDNYYINKYEKEGTFSGTILAMKGKWLLSTDIGCAFISLDGISQAYEFLKWDCLKVYVEKMHAKFKCVDLYGGTFQTHATLSCLRGLIRFYNYTNNNDVLQTVKETFKLYQEKGICENYSNCNRFSIAKWTEPCAIVDSYMCAVELYKITKNVEYLDFAQKVYFNAISHMQLPNGGMGLQNCPGYHGIEKLGYNRNNAGEIFEAYWCCTMRGGDGIAYVSQTQCMKENNEYSFINFFDCAVIDDDVSIEMISKYPAEGKVLIKLDNPSNKEIKLNLYIPNFAKTVNVNGVKTNVEDGFAKILTSKEQETFEIEFEIPLIEEKCTNVDKIKYMHGNVLLGADTDKVGKLNLIHKGGFIYETEDGVVFDMIGKTIYQEMAEIDRCDIKIIF